MKPRLVTLKHAAAELGVPYRTLLELIETGALAAVDLRAPKTARPRWWLDRGVVDRFLEIRTKNPNQRAERVTSRLVPRISGA